MRTTFKEKGLSVLVLKDIRVELQTLLGVQRIVWPTALPDIIGRKYIVIVDDKLHLLFL